MRLTSTHLSSSPVQGDGGGQCVSGGEEAEEEQEAPGCAQVWDRLLPS